jgi:hypothetical protein
MFLNLFEASFPFQERSVGEIRNDWITQGIKISCRHKRSKKFMKAYYNKYRKIMSRVIKEAKRQHRKVRQ